jgi:beta-glucosidase/6-phospho-beta-glucosidase/beta-galactosidase
MKSPFNSFFMGGFECADQINRSGERVNLMTETKHDIWVKEDYQLLNELGVKVVREGICWSRAETAPNVFDFSYLVPFYKAANELGFQIIWDLCHFGYPDGLIPTHPQFTSRFVALCEAFYLFHSQHSKEPLMVVPINEISFLSWHSGDVRGTVPFAVNSGDDIKYHLGQAAIKGAQKLKEVSPDCLIFAVEPLIKIHAADDTISCEELALLNHNQFKSMDILLGKAFPELGGNNNLFDYLGFNYYYNNQWDHQNTPIPWPEKDRPLTPLSHLLQMAYQRYFKPMVLTETGHFGEGRDRWIKEITVQCIEALKAEVDLQGICIYPVIDRPDWDDLSIYSKSGIWDFNEEKERIPDQPYIDSFKECFSIIERYSESVRTSQNVSEVQYDK